MMCSGSLRGWSSSNVGTALKSNRRHLLSVCGPARRMSQPALTASNRHFAAPAAALPPATPETTTAASNRGGRHLPAELLIRLPHETSHTSPRVAVSALPFLHQILEHYAERTPGLQAVVQRVMRPCWPEAPELGHDHFAFRTFGVPGLGISSLERLLVPLGYREVHSDPPLAFPGKKLVARYFVPVDPELRAVLPRVFVSELQVERLSPGAQAVILDVTQWAEEAGRAEVDVQVLTALLTGTAPWARPTLEQYTTLMAESEYAAWVLAHGYSLNHSALALHRLPHGAGPAMDMEAFAGRLAAAGLALNGEGGVVKVSPDALLLQSAVVADRVPYTFACGQRCDIPGAYVEFVKRLPLPQFANIQPADLREQHLREGFEVGNADRIFESTTLASAGRA